MLASVALLAAPMACWSLAAGTFRGRVAGVALLAVLTTAQCALGNGWLGHDFQLTGIAVLAALIILVLLGAPILEPLTVGAAQAPTGKGKARIIIGRTLSYGYCLLAAVVLAIAVFLLPMVGRFAWVPPGDAILPLPDDLSLIETADNGCTFGSTSYCSRTFVIGAASGSPDEIAARVRRHIEESFEWTLRPGKSSGDARDYWSSDPRMEGWALDQYRTKVSVSIRHERVTVLLSYLDDW